MDTAPVVVEAATPDIKKVTGAIVEDPVVVEAVVAEVEDNQYDSGSENEPSTKQKKKKRHMTPKVVLPVPTLSGSEDDDDDEEAAAAEEEEDEEDDKTERRHRKRSSHRSKKSHKHSSSKRRAEPESSEEESSSSSDDDDGDSDHEDDKAQKARALNTPVSREKYPLYRLLQFLYSPAKGTLQPMIIMTQSENILNCDTDDTFVFAAAPPAPAGPKVCTVFTNKKSELTSSVDPLPLVLTRLVHMLDGSDRAANEPSIDIWLHLYYSEASPEGLYQACTAIGRGQKPQAINVVSEMCINKDDLTFQMPPPHPPPQQQQQQQQQQPQGGMPPSGTQATFNMVPPNVGAPAAAAAAVGQGQVSVNLPDGADLTVEQAAALHEIGSAKADGKSSSHVKIFGMKVHKGVLVTGAVVVLALAGVGIFLASRKWMSKKTSRARISKKEYEHMASIEAEAPEGEDLPAPMKVPPPSRKLIAAARKTKSSSRREARSASPSPASRSRRREASSPQPRPSAAASTSHPRSPPARKTTSGSSSSRPKTSPSNAPPPKQRK